MSYILAHTRLGFCSWDIIAAIILIAIIVLFAVNAKKMSDKQKDLEDQISNLYANDSLNDSAEPLTE